MLPLGPAIEGIESYKGKLSHSANWDQSIDWKGKRVAVIGSGSAAVQTTPYFAQGELLSRHRVSTNEAKLNQHLLNYTDL